MGTIINIRKSFNYTIEGTSVNITSSNGTYDPSNGRVNFNGQLSAVANDATYIGDFSYNEYENGRINMNINVDASKYADASAQIIASVADIKSQMTE